MLTIFPTVFTAFSEQQTSVMEAAWSVTFTVMLMGVCGFVHRDAAWEQEPNAFQELLERYSRCDAEKCLCPQGREHDGSAGT